MGPGEICPAIDTLATPAPDNKDDDDPDAGLAVYLVVLGLMTSIFIQKRVRKQRHSSAEETETERRGDIE